MVIIAGSGMCTGGRIVDHLKHGLEDPKNDIFFVGYQAKGTPGRRMIEKQIPVKAGIHTLTGYSAHADQRMLVNWVKSMPQPPEQIRLVHGESHARQAMIKALGLPNKKSHRFAKYTNLSLTQRLGRDNSLPVEAKRRSRISGPS